MTGKISCCYLLLEENGKRTYCGVTNNLERRLAQHNGGSGGARYTRGHRWFPVCTVEGFENRSHALSFEWWMKHARGGLVGGTGRSGGKGRCQRMVRLLSSNVWWKRRPPQPTQLTLRIWSSSLHLGLAHLVLENVPNYVHVVIGSQPLEHIQKNASQKNKRSKGIFTCGPSFLHECFIVPRNRGRSPRRFGGTNDKPRARNC